MLRHLNVMRWHKKKSRFLISPENSQSLTILGTHPMWRHLAGTEQLLPHGEAHAPAGPRAIAEIQVPDPGLGGMLGSAQKS